MVDPLDESALLPSNDVSLPVELLHIILQHAVNPALGMSTIEHQERHKAGAVLVRTCKAFREFVVPLMYRQIVLVRKGHLRRFGRAVASSRGAALVARHTKALWVLCDSFDVTRTEIILKACNNLEHLVVRINGTQMLGYFRKVAAHCSLRELTLIDPVGSVNTRCMDLNRLHIITTVVNAHATLRMIHGLPRIPKLCIEMTSGSWDGQLYPDYIQEDLFFTMAQQIQPRSNRIWLKVHDAVKRDWQFSDVLSEKWWLSHTDLPTTQDDLNRMKVTTMDEDGLDPAGLERALQAIDYNATHWAELESDGE